MYHVLPKKSKQLWTVLCIVISYGIVFLYLKTNFPEIEDETKVFLNQYGLLIIFTSGLLASTGTFWSTKVKQNKSLALESISNAERTIEILKSQAVQLKIDFGSQINKHNVIIAEAKSKLEEVESHPSFIDFSVHISVAALAVGTLMCIIGAG